MKHRLAGAGLAVLVAVLTACGGTPSSSGAPSPNASSSPVASSHTPRPQPAVDPLSLDVCALLTTALGGSAYASLLPAPSSGKQASTDRSSVYCDYRPQPAGDNVNLTILTAARTQTAFDADVHAELARGGALYGPLETLSGIGDSAYSLAYTAPTVASSKNGFASIYVLVRGVELRIAAQEQTRSSAEVAQRGTAVATQIARVIGATV